MTQSPIHAATRDSDAALALTALGWILADGERAERFLALTGLTPDSLRGALNQTAVQAAILTFLTNHENDLVSCAAAIDSAPAVLAAAAARLDALAT
jgi:hypothetical protein